MPSGVTSIQATVWVVAGPPGAGKSTVASLLLAALSPATLHSRLTTRGSHRDTEKLADFAAFTASMRLGAEPAAPHVTIDNRLGCPAPLEVQVAALAAGER